MDEPHTDLGWDLAAWGKVVLLETRGRRSGRLHTTPVGFVEEPDGCLLVAAGDAHTQWAQNLLVQPCCRAAREGRTLGYRAEPLTGSDHHQVVTALILRYGTPAERLGMGPSFRLRPAGPTNPAPPTGVP
jgi:deazaflavin-dependent oxidoreductase (nitroreductase family)